MDLQTRSPLDCHLPEHGRGKACVLVAGSDAALRRRLLRGLGREPSVTPIHEARDRGEVERALDQLNPAILLLDFPMPGFHRPGSLRSIHALSPSTRTVLLVRSPDDSAAVGALKEGAKGYCSRTTDPRLLLKAIHLVEKGEFWVRRRVINRLVEELTALERKRGGKGRELYRKLTLRERQISGLVARGSTNREVAESLSIVEKTVKAHMTSIFRKLNLASRLQLAIYTLQVAPVPDSD
ncbi:MAG: hypothetical protein AUH81_00465 [Candidatus Rokubacteria bacterium 13_1_40CM_4_69_5]|nr:MAG: hypothetical protein AUH81_00465 [Candidatus Rokubacteria bacterium 13_1_40CM_4_69_5]